MPRKRASTDGFQCDEGSISKEAAVHGSTGPTTDFPPPLPHALLELVHNSLRTIVCDAPKHCLRVMQCCREGLGVMLLLLLLLQLAAALLLLEMLVVLKSSHLVGVHGFL